jgi:hypothetical protein
MSGLAVGAFATVAVGAMSAQSANKNSKRATRAAENATRAQMDLYDKNIKRSDRIVDDQQLIANEEILDLQRDLDYFNDLAQKALDSNDQAAYATYKEQLDLINTYEKDLLGTYQETYGDLSDLVGDAKAQEIQTITARDQDRNAYMDQLKGTAQNSLGNANMLAAEKEKVLAQGTRPSELDTVNSEIEANFRDAGAELDKREASMGRDGSRGSLALAIQEAKAKAGASAGLRQGHADNRLNQIMNLASSQQNSMANANQDGANALAVGVSGDNMKNDAMARYFDMMSKNRASLGEQAASTLGDTAMKRLGVTTGYQGNKNSAQQEYLKMLAGNQAGFTAGKLDTRNTLLNTKLAGLDSAVNSGNKSAEVYGDIASANLGAASQFANQRDQAWGQALAGITDYAKNYKAPPKTTNKSIFV